MDPILERLFAASDPNVQQTERPEALMAAPGMAPRTANYGTPPKKPGLLDRLFGVGIPSGLLSDEDKRSARQRAIIMAGLKMMQAGAQPGASFGGSLAAGLGGGIEAGMQGFGQAAEGAMAEQKMQQTQQVQQARQMIYAKFPPVPNETPIQMLQRYAKMLPEFMRIGDTEMVGKLTELLKSVGGPAFGIEKTGTEKNPMTKTVDVNGKPMIFERDPNTGEWKNTGLMDYQKPGSDRPTDRLTLNQMATQANAMGRDYKAEMRDVFSTYRLMGGAERDAAQALAGDTAAQVQLMYTFIKAMDPGSVVREGEIGLVQSAMPIISKIKTWEQKGLMNKAGLLDTKTAQEMLNLIRRRRKDYIKYADEIRSDYIDRAKFYTGVDGQTIPESTFRPLRGTVADQEGNADKVAELLTPKAPQMAPINPMNPFGWKMAP